MTRTEALQSLVESIHEKPVSWGIDDCTMLAAGWVGQQTGIQISTKQYLTKREAYKKISEFGGLDKIWEWSLDGVLQQNYGSPKIGDVGLIHTDKYGLVGVIFAQAEVAIWRTDNGYTFLSPRKNTIHAVWSLPDEK